jgi:hypothetical protein
LVQEAERCRHSRLIASNISDYKAPADVPGFLFAQTSRPNPKRDVCSWHMADVAVSAANVRWRL